MMPAGALLPRAITLPLELKYHVISMLDTPSLSAMCRVNSALSAEAERYLYMEVRISNEKQIEGFVYGLARDARRSKRVQNFTILDFGAHQHPLVHQVLKSMSNLRSLAILPNITDVAVFRGWDALLTGCDFKLLEFVTSFDCDRALTDFLVKQTHIERYIHSGCTSTHIIDILHDPQVLPSLKHFHGNIVDLNIIIPHRPVTHVTIEETIAAIGLALFVLRPLRDSKGPIEYLSLSLMDPVDSWTLQVIQEYTPHLRTLELAAPRGQFSELSWCSALCSFKHIHHLKYETSLMPDGESHPVEVGDQEQLVYSWANSLPLLQTIEFSAEVLGDESDSYLTQVVYLWTLSKGKWVCEQEERTGNGW